MSKSDNDPVTEKLCEARRQTIQEQIDGLKKIIYAVSATTTTIIVIVQFILTLLKG
jgi:hypothetical protein